MKVIKVDDEVVDRLSEFGESPNKAIKNLIDRASTTQVPQIIATGIPERMSDDPYFDDWNVIDDYDPNEAPIMVKQFADRAWGIKQFGQNQIVFWKDKE